LPSVQHNGSTAIFYNAETHTISEQRANNYLSSANELIVHVAGAD